MLRHEIQQTLGAELAALRSEVASLRSEVVEKVGGAPSTLDALLAPR